MVKEIMDKGVIDFVDKNNRNAFQYITELVGRVYKNRQVKILLVDDSKSALEVVQHMLEKQKFQVLLAENGMAALEILQQNNDIKVILSDYAMPKMDGLELTIRIREIVDKECMSIIGISGMDHTDLSSNFIKNGANDFLVKPFSYNELLCRVNQNLDMLEHMEYIRNLANRDYMTKVYNRRYFFTHGQELYQQAKQNNMALAVCMIDIDHFKQVNDNYGHDCGDAILINFAKVLMEHFEGHLVARLGGEEFAVLFNNIDYDGVLQQLEIFRTAIAATPIECDEHSISITVSIGAHDQYQVNIDGMLKEADNNLYTAKESGRNQVIGG